MNALFTIIFFVVGFNSFCFGYPENIDEIFRRKDRQLSASWGPEYAENSLNHYIWQPETFSYIDINTGREVWRLTSSSNFHNALQDISWPTFSADGKRFAFKAFRKTKSFLTNYWEKYGLWFVMKADGTFLRPMPNSPSRTAVHQTYFHWSPAEKDICFLFGRNYAGEKLNKNDLFKVFISDTKVTRKLFLTFPDGQDEYSLKKAISSDGTKIIARTKNKLWPTTIYPVEKRKINVADGYSYRRPWDNYWGYLSGFSGTYHDQFLTGAGNNIWFHVMPEGTRGTWLRMKLTGSYTDRGPNALQDRNAPYNWGGELEYVNTSASKNILKEGDCELPHRDPYCCDNDLSTQCSVYFSHYTIDRWGRYVIFSNGEKSSVGIWDIESLKYAREFFEDNKGNKRGAQHHDWHAWSDWSASSSSPKNYANQQILTQKYSDPYSQISLCSAHIRINGDSNNYESLARPTQSPDGTKIIWHSTFLNSSDLKADIFYVVAYYPYPPEITMINESSTGDVKIRFDWRLNTKSPRGYTDRGWPDEQTDIPPPPRETKLFRLWRSIDGNSWIPVSTTPANIFEKFDFVYGGFKSGQNPYWEINDTPGPGTWYYAVTSQEHSGLESRILSNIWRIVLNNNGNIVETGEVTSYPRNPGGIESFYRTPPPDPENLHVTKKSTPGHYLLTWIEPKDFIIRYYNIYYSTDGVPPVDQRYRIASIPVSVSKWLDWNAHPSKKGYYLITCVDYQGNESKGISGEEGEESDLHAPAGLKIKKIN